MSVGIPSSLGEAKAILVIGQDTISEAAKSRETGEFLFFPSVQVIQYPLPSRYIDHSPEIRVLHERNMLKDGLMLIPHPYDKESYIEVDGSLKEIANTTLNKARVFSDFCSALGATEVKFSETKVTKEESDISGQIGVDAKTVNVKAGGEKKFKSSVTEALKTSRTYPARPTNFDEARKIAFKSCLHEDSLFKAILSSREQGVLTFDENISLTSDVSSSVNALFELGIKIPMVKDSKNKDGDDKKEKNKKNGNKSLPLSGSLLKIKANIDAVSKEYEEIHLHIHVKFENV